MGFMDEKLWEVLQSKVLEEDAGIRPERQIGNEYLAAIKGVCQYGVERAITIRDTFPMFTLHNEIHICNVMRLMACLMGDNIADLTRDETAMLILSACCHDIGMSYSDVDKEELLADSDRINQYLDNNHSEYVKAYAGGEEPIMTDDMIQNYLRSIHHERIMDLLCSMEWPVILEGKVAREDLIHVCQSHGNDISVLDTLEPTNTIDLRFCAIMLRLADILDFDTSRAPKSVYEYSGLIHSDSANVEKSREEWNKHMTSHGFDFTHIADRSYPYMLDYSATCKAMQIEQTVNSYLDWVDKELSDCGKQIKRFSGKWQDFVLPGKIKRNIRSEGYVSGQYRLTLDQEQILELLVGKDLYSDPTVFVRELIQNAIDAVRTRKQLDKSLPPDWKGQINIRCWMDNEGYHWFRIEDNGIGMTEDIIMNYFLKIGCSYYTSDTFLQTKHRCKADPNYMPISRFGIGILSCFMGDKETNQVEISTKHFNEEGKYYPALRLSMQGMNGYYYLASKAQNHMPGPMKGITPREKEQYLKQAGTIIAVRANLYHTGKHRSFKEIIDRYVTYPSVAIHYDGIGESNDYPTESEFMDDIHNIQVSNDVKEGGIIELELSEEQLNEIYKERPEIIFKEKPKLLLKCIPLDDYTESPYLTGATLQATVIGRHEPIQIRFGSRIELVKVDLRLNTDTARKKLGIEISLEFDSSFEERMRLMERECQDREMYIYHYIEEAYTLVGRDNYQMAIIDSISRNYFRRIDWKKYMMETYQVSEDLLKKEVQKIKKKFPKLSNGMEGTSSEVIAFKKYQNMRKKWMFELCDLSCFKWYTDYFQNTKKHTGLFSVVAHNGILCGNAEFFSKSQYVQGNLGTIVLLKDKYRPNVDVAREGIRKLSLETSAELETVKRQIRKNGFDIKSDLSTLDECGYSYLPMKNYMDLLEKRGDLRAQLIFHTNIGLLNKEELDVAIEKNGKVRFIDSPLLSNRSAWNKNDKLYEYLCASYLRKNYSVFSSFNRYRNEIFIMKKNEDIPIGYQDVFPAFFF